MKRPFMRSALQSKHLGLVAILFIALLSACGGNSASRGTGSGAIRTGKSSTPTNTAVSKGGADVCTPGVSVISGVTTQQYCGKANAQATVAGEHQEWSGGACFAQAGLAGVNIGRHITDPTNSSAVQILKKQYDYFGAQAHATTDGSYGGTITGVYHGAQFSATGTISFTNSLRAGSFTGGAITATWTC